MQSELLSYEKRLDFQNLQRVGIVNNHNPFVNLVNGRGNGSQNKLKPVIMVIEINLVDIRWSSVWKSILWLPRLW